MQGTIKFFNVDKGFGFIIPDDGSSDVFFHVTNCEDEGAQPEENAIVTYEIGTGRDGRPAAQNVVLTGEYAEASEEE